MRTEWNQNVQFAGTLFVANLLHSFGRDPLHLHAVKLVAKLQQRKETETSQYSLDQGQFCIACTGSTLSL